MKPRRLFPYVLVGIISWWLGHSAFTVVDGLSDCEEPADAAVILGNTVNQDGTLSERLRQRLACGLKLYRAGQVKTLIVSGGLGKEGFCEGSKMRDYLRQQDVPDSAIVVDNHGDNTRQTVANTIPILDSLHAHRLLVVSQYYHLTRTKMLFRQAGLQPVGSVGPVYFEVRDLYSLVREFVAYYQQLLATADTQG